MSDADGVNVTYTANAPVLGYGKDPDDAIDDLFAELDMPPWGKWYIVGEITLRRTEGAAAASIEQRWTAEVTVSRTVDVVV